MNESVILLIESADRCMDDEYDELRDWEFISSYVIDETYINFLSAMSHVPCIGRFAQKELFHHFSLSFLPSHYHSNIFF